jgi:Holliday junction resolvasome RuvABC endonuclease subunit
MKVLALDLGSKTGFAIGSSGRVSESGVFQASMERGESRGMFFIRWGAWFKEMLSKLTPDLVVYEMPHARGGAATDVLVGLSTRVAEYCTAAGVEYGKVHSMTLKKWATGSGKANKEEMIVVAYERTLEKITSDDQADAILLCLYQMERT